MHLYNESYQIFDTSRELHYEKDILMKMRNRRYTFTISILIIISMLLLMTTNYNSPTIQTIQPVDFDITVPVFRNNKTYAFLTSWDDEMDDLQMSYLMDTIGAKQTSFVVTDRMDNKQLWGLDLLFRGHDIQSHSSQHINHHRLNASMTNQLLNESVNDIERLFGYEPIVFAYPFGGNNVSNNDIVMRYFDVARGITEENMTAYGAWPIPYPPYAKHSAMREDGIKDSDVYMVFASFKGILKNGPYRAYKAYGHTRWLSASNKEVFIKELKMINESADVWFASWGEAISYQIQRDNLIIKPIISNDLLIQFKTDLPLDQDRYCVKNTYMVQIPSEWTNISVIDDGVSISHNRTGNTLMFHSRPHNQTINIRHDYVQRFQFTMVKNLRYIQTKEGTAFIVDVFSSSEIKSIRIFVTTPEGVLVREMGNPLFWANNTYGAVFFSIFNFTDIKIETKNIS
jgi:hypothetical protein